MSGTLHLKPETEAGLLARAQASGVTVEEYLLSIVEGALPLSPTKSLTPDERAAAFEAWAKQHSPTPALSDYAVSREAMYKAATGNECPR